MSQRRNRLPEGTVNYKEMLKEAEEEIADLEDRLAQVAAIAAPEVDHERIERLEVKLDLFMRELLSPDSIEKIQSLMAEAEEQTT